MEKEGRKRQRWGGREEERKKGQRKPKRKKGRKTEFLDFIQREFLESRNTKTLSILRVFRNQTIMLAKLNSSNIKQNHSYL